MIGFWNWLTGRDVTPDDVKVVHVTPEAFEESKIGFKPIRLCINCKWCQSVKNGPSLCAHNKNLSLVDGKPNVACLAARDGWCGHGGHLFEAKA